MDNLHAIEMRKSRRSFLKTKISEDNLNTLNNLIKKYNDESGLSIQIIEDGSSFFDDAKKSYGLFKHVRTVIAFVGDSTDKDMLEKVGYYGEMLVLEATKLRLGTCWVGGSFNRSSSKIKLGLHQQLTCVIPIGNIDEASFKEKVIKNVISRKTRDLEYFYTSNRDVPSWFLAGIKAVQKAPSGMNAQPILFKYHNGEVRVYISPKSDYRFKNVDLGIAKLHFEIGAVGKFELGDNAIFIEQ